MTAEEAYNYHLWHPRLRQDGALVFNVTPGEQASPPVASRKFMADLLKTFRLSAEPGRMEIFTYRSGYHSEPDASDWEDRWPVNWRIALFAASPIQWNPRLKHEYIGTMAFDPVGIDEEPPSEYGCLIIADFETVAAAETCRNKIRDSKPVSGLRQKQKALEPEFERVVLGEFLIQEQICLGRFPDKFFQRGAKYAMAVEKVCRGAGGITTFEERATEREELFDANGIE